MMRPRSLAASLFLATVACGGSPKPEPSHSPDDAGSAAPEATTAPTTSGSAEGKAAPAASPRAKQTALILNAMKEPDMGGYWYARMVAVGFTETGDYKLAASWKKSFAALAGDKLDPSQCERILQATIEEGDIKPAAEKRCGKMDALGKSIAAGKTPAAQVVAATKACKIDGVKGDENTAWAVVTAALVEDELAAQPETTADEKALAQRIRGLCLMPK